MHCNVVLWSQNNVLHGVEGELRTNSAIPFLGGHRMALGCSGLHANVVLMPDEIAPRQNIYVELAPPSIIY